MVRFILDMSVDTKARSGEKLSLKPFHPNPIGQCVQLMKDNASVVSLTYAPLTFFSVKNKIGRRYVTFTVFSCTYAPIRTLHQTLSNSSNRIESNRERERERAIEWTQMEIGDVDKHKLMYTKSREQWSVSMAIYHHITHDASSSISHIHHGHLNP